MEQIFIKVAFCQKCSGYHASTYADASQKNNPELPVSKSNSSHFHTNRPCMHALVAGLQREYQPQHNQQTYEYKALQRTHPGSS